MAEIERDSKKAAFRVKKKGLLRDLKQAQAEKVEAKKAGDFKAKVQKEIQVYKRLKYEQEYKDRLKEKHQDTLLRLMSLEEIKVHLVPWPLMPRFPLLLPSQLQILRTHPLVESPSSKASLRGIVDG